MELYSGELVRSSKGRNERTAKQRLIIVSCVFFLVTHCFGVLNSCFRWDTLSWLKQDKVLTYSH